MSYTRDPRIAKLPQWAQSEFERLERKVRDLTGALESVDSPEDSNVTLDPYSDYSRDLPRNPTIRHHVDGQRGRGYFETKFDGEKLSVRGVADSAFDDFLIVPALANEIVIEFRRKH